MLSLPHVTLCCIYNVAERLHWLAASECMRRAVFGGIKVFARGDYERFVHYEMPKQIRTSHILLIQWDSWILNPSAWREEFLSYDYIGAPWWYNDEYNVGNSGFCLISKRLMEFLASHEKEFRVGRPYDDVLCRQYQRRLAQFKWAPEALAWRFSFERTTIYPLNEVFGFHGSFNFPIVLSPEALAERLSLGDAEPHIASKIEWKDLSWRIRVQKEIAYA